MSIDREMDEEDVVHIYNGILAIKNEILPFAIMWMDLDDIMLSEVSQTEIDKYYILSLTHGNKTISEQEQWMVISI